MLTVNKYDLMAIQSMDTDALKNELAKTLTITADYLMYIAAIWQELENRGVDLSHLRHGMMSYIPMIATRQLDARFVVNYAGQKTLLSHIAKLPLSEQSVLIDKGEIDVAEIDPGGKMTVRKMPISNLSASQISQVFGDGEIKDIDRQYNMLIARKQAREKLSKKTDYQMTDDIKIEDNSLIIAGKYKVDINDILTRLSNEKRLNFSVGSKYNWLVVDWSKSNRQIAQEIGAKASYVSTARRTYAQIQ